MQFLDANASPRTRLSAPDGDPEIDMRTREQKMADAFVRAFTTAAKSKHTSTQGGAAPTLLVTVPMSEINKHANGKPALARVSRTQEFVPVAEVSRIICDGAVQAAITDDSGNVLKLGRSQRLFSPTQRKALNVAYPTCATDGCTIPSVWDKRLTGHFRGKTGHREPPIRAQSTETIRQDRFPITIKCISNASR